MSTPLPASGTGLLEHESGFSFEDHEEHIEVNEMMVIEINFGKGKKGDVVVHYGDDPAD